jgi:hypothetical protein
MLKETNSQRVYSRKKRKKLREGSPNNTINNYRKLSNRKILQQQKDQNSNIKKKLKIKIPGKSTCPSVSQRRFPYQNTCSIFTRHFLCGTEQISNRNTFTLPHNGQPRPAAGQRNCSDMGAPTKILSRERL